MKRIDFLGAPGVGKTTLYNSLLQQRGRHEKWLTVEEAKLLIAKRYVRNNFYSIKELARLLILNTVKKRVLQNKLSENICNSLTKQALKDKLDDWMPFIDLCGESLGDLSKPSYYRFLLAKWLLSQLDDVVLVESVDFNYTVLFDESLSQRATGLMPWDYSFGERQSRRYYNLIPPPYAVVYLCAEPQQIIKRITDRPQKSFIVQHQGLSCHELLERTKIAAMIVEIGAGILRERGIPVLELDAELPIDEIVVVAQNFISKN